MYRQSEKLLKQQYLLHMSAQYGELRPTNGWDRFTTLGQPSKFQPVSRLGFVTAPTSLNGGQRKLAQRLAVSWTGTLYLRGLLPPNGILPGATFTLRPSFALSYIARVSCSVTARHSGSLRQANFAACDKAGNYEIFAPGLRHHPSAHILVYFLSFL